MNSENNVQITRKACKIKSDELPIDFKSAKDFEELKGTTDSVLKRK